MAVISYDRARRRHRAGGRETGRMDLQHQNPTRQTHRGAAHRTRRAGHAVGVAPRAPLGRGRTRVAVGAGQERGRANTRGQLGVAAGLGEGSPAPPRTPERNPMPGGGADRRSIPLANPKRLAQAHGTVDGERGCWRPPVRTVSCRPVADVAGTRRRSDPPGG